MLGPLLSSWCFLAVEALIGSAEVLIRVNASQFPGVFLAMVICIYGDFATLISPCCHDEVGRTAKVLTFPDLLIIFVPSTREFAIVQAAVIDETRNTVGSSCSNNEYQQGDKI